MNKIARSARHALRLLIGALFCQTLILSVAVVGWVYRFMRRTILLHWWSESHARRKAGTFEEFLDGIEDGRKHLDLPPWIFAPGSWFPAALGSNIALGAKAILNTWVLTMPGCVLWLFAWHAGWSTSFFKGYEQFWVGPTTGLMGTALFMTAMLYVPMAQARQASTGEARSFYQNHTVWSVVKEKWATCAALAGLYAAVSFPVTVLKTFPKMLAVGSPAISALGPAEALEFLQHYFFWAGLAFFAAYVLLHWAAARVYAAGILEAVREGRLTKEDLAPNEREALERLGLLELETRPPRHWLIKGIYWAGERTGRAAALPITLALWFAFIAQIFVSEFFSYHPGIGWLNQPLVQLPYFRYIPKRLREASASEDR